MERIKGKIRFSYDKENDVLYSFINKPRKATCRELGLGNGILIRIDPDINKIVGFTVIDYERRKRDGLLKTVPYFKDIKLPEYN